mgnify:CR=1 FL=1
MGHRILIVEDEVIIAEDIFLNLERLGYSPLNPAISYNRALKAIEQKNFDFALLDINLGGKSRTGIDVAHHLNKTFPKPFVFLTSYSDSDTLELAKKTSPYGFLVKPFKKEDLHSTIEVAMSNYKRFNPPNKSQDPAVILETLSNTEKIILRYIAQGKTTPEIAILLNVSKNTVKNHRHNISQKLEISGTTNSLVTWAMQNYLSK